MLLVEHHMSLVMRVSDHVNVLSFGRQDRRRNARRGAGGPGRDRGLPRERGRRVTRAARARGRRGPLRRRSRRCTGSRSRCRRARSWPCSARTAPARRRRCARSPGTVRRERRDHVRRASRSRGGPEAVARAGHRARARGPRHVHRADGDARTSSSAPTRAATARRQGGHRAGGRRTSRGFSTAATSRPARSPAASSRCSRSPAR